MACRSAHDPRTDLPAAIAVRGLRHNTLQNLDVDIPLWQLVAVVGVSGSGKSSLAMGTLYAEGLYRFLAALSTYSRRRLTQSQRPVAERISHLPPAVALRQRPPVPGPRSTVGTMSEVFNVLRLAMSRLGTHICPNGHAVPASSATQREEVTCPECGVVFPRPGAESFAFNSAGACPACKGLGERTEVDIEGLVPDPSRTIRGGAVLSWTFGTRRLSALAAECLGVRIDVPFNELSADELTIVFHGEPTAQTVTIKTRGGREYPLEVRYDNAVTAAARALESTSERVLHRAAPFSSTQTCTVCRGTRLSREALTSRMMGKNLGEISRLDLRALARFADDLLAGTPDDLGPVADGLRAELTSRLDPLIGLGVGYLSVSRAGASLSTGERQRLELTATISAATTGMLYVLDEPSAGLHPSNVDGLARSLRALVAEGNSVVIVEHDRRLISEADWVIEFGPGAGPRGGRVIAQGAPRALSSQPGSQIGPMLADHPAEPAYAPPPPPPIAVEPPLAINMEVDRLYNLRNVSLHLPVRQITAVAGPSGSGKTALMLDSLAAAVRAVLARKRVPRHVRSIAIASIRQLAVIDSTPIGANARSTPATYVGALDILRRRFATTDGARRRGWGPERFSFNRSFGQCPTCRGLGVVDVDLQYLPDLSVSCPTCHGSRYGGDVLLVELDGLTIADALALTIEQALLRFADDTALVRRLRPVAEVGLGHLRLGEPTPSLSGGEAQRLRLARGLLAPRTDALYILDEPTIGLHPLDIRRLWAVLRRLVGDGATVVVIDHDRDLLSWVDHLIDLGPGGGGDGGRIVAAGTPAELRHDPASVTGRWLTTDRPPAPVT